MDEGIILSIAGLVVASVAIIVFPIIATWRLSKLHTVVSDVPNIKQSLKSCYAKIEADEEQWTRVCAELNTKVDVLWGVMVQDALTETWRNRLGTAKSPTVLTEEGRNLLNHGDIPLDVKIDCMVTGSPDRYATLEDEQLTMLLYANFRDDLAELAKVKGIALRTVLGTALAYAREVINKR